MTRSRFFWILSSVLVIVFIIIFGYKDRSVEISPSFKTSTMYELQMTHKEYDKVEWELSASKALFPMDKKEIQLKSINLTINYSPKIYITSDNGTYEVEKGDITLDRAVEFNTEDAKFTTDTLKWNSKDELVTTQDPVKFIGKSFFIEGIGLTANINQQKIRILKNVKAVFYH